MLSLLGVEGPLVVGLSAPQGSGKTTIVRFLRQLLQGQGLSTVVLSIDDFYLTNAQQKVRHEDSDASIKRDLGYLHH
jgi:pantothenate kinase-related protein Tda10